GRPAPQGQPAQARPQATAARPAARPPVQPGQEEETPF
ncbi:MAG TPA: single-stranded DNA-binding protein, partial [Deinococcus radiodurans]|nr:single-stranded DNA-binding protein [Deinococcus radiodurans]